MAVESPFKNVQVLLVEDEEFIRGVILQLLWEWRIQQVVQAKDGEEALGILRQSGNTIDLILLDMEMPKKNGLQVILEIQEKIGPPVSDIPIVVISGVQDPDLVRALGKRGIRHFLLKPVSKTDLGARMAAALGVDLTNESGAEKAPWMR